MGKKSRSKKRSHERPKNEPEPGIDSSLGAAASAPAPVGDPDPTPSYGYKAGDLVYQGMPLAFVVKDEYVPLVCHYCLSVNPTVPCGSCDYSKYCRVQCKLDDRFHEFECYQLQASAPNYPSAFVRYISQIVVKCKVDEWGAEGEVLDQYAVTFKDLECCRHQIGDIDLYNKMCEDYKAVLQYLDNDHLIPFDVFAELYCKALQHVCKVYVPYSYRSKAIGLYFGLQFFKHSCTPNAIQTWNGRELLVRMMEGVDRKNILLISINTLGYTSREQEGRTAKMKKLCIPKCFCKRCKNLEEDKDFSAFLRQCPKSVFKRVDCSSKLLKTLKNTFEGDLGKMLKIGSAAWDDMGGLFGNLHFLRAKIARSLCYAYFRLFKFRESTVFCLKYLQFCEVYYGPNHVRTALAYLCLSYLDALQNKQTSVKNYEQAMEKFLISLGPEHPCFKCLCADYDTLAKAGGWTADNIKKTMLSNCVFKGKAFEF